MSTRGNFASLSCEAQEKYVKKKSCSGTPGVYINRFWAQKLVLGTLKNWPMSACGDTVCYLSQDPAPGRWPICCHVQACLSVTDLFSLVYIVLFQDAWGYPISGACYCWSQDNTISPQTTMLLRVCYICQTCHLSQDLSYLLSSS